MGQEKTKEDGFQKPASTCEKSVGHALVITSAPEINAMDMCKNEVSLGFETYRQGSVQATCLCMLSIFHTNLESHQYLWTLLTLGIPTLGVPYSWGSYLPQLICRARHATEIM